PSRKRPAVPRRAKQTVITLSFHGMTGPRIDRWGNYNQVRFGLQLAARGGATTGWVAIGGQAAETSGSDRIQTRSISSPRRLYGRQECPTLASGGSALQVRSGWYRSEILIVSS